MKILVTGGSGFIGSNFIINLLKNNKEIDIVNLDAGFYGSNPLNLSELEKIGPVTRIEAEQLFTR